jgi:hypothetical protein
MYRKNFNIPKGQVRRQMLKGLPAKYISLCKWNLLELSSSAVSKIRNT